MMDPDLRCQHDSYGNASHLLSTKDKEALEQGNWQRASGECVCFTCGKAYWQHPMVLGALWLHRVCGNILVHL